MIKLYGFGPFFSLTDASPFVLKVDTYLKLAHIPYERYSGMSYYKKAPKGKMPYIQDGDTIISDSTVIFTYLAKHYINLDSSLTKEEKAFSHIILKFIDEHLYWCIVYSRWAQKDTWKLIREKYFNGMPALLKLFISSIVRNNMLKQLKAQGISKHSKYEILIILRDALNALAHILKKDDFFLGQTNPTSIDASIYAFLTQMMLPNYNDDFIRLTKSYPTLVGHVNRINRHLGNKSNPI